MRDGTNALAAAGAIFMVLTVVGVILAIGIIKRKERKGRKVKMAKPSAPGYHTGEYPYSQVLDSYDRNTR